MPDVLTETKHSSVTDQNPQPLLEGLWHPQQQALASAKEVAGNNEPATVTRVSDTAPGTPASAKGLLPLDLEQNLKNLQQSLSDTQKQIAELQKTSNSGLYDLELSRRSLVENPYKILTAGTGLAALWKSPALSTIPLTGLAALQGYDDFKNLRDQTTWAGRGKYTLGLLSDTAVGAGSLAFLTESVPMKYKAPLLLGGLIARTAIDFIPNKK